VQGVAEGVDGVVVTHGTDTMGYTSAALSFALAGVPLPVVLVGAQRSSDRPSSDATLNLIGGVSVAARAPFAGVYVAMHADESDEKVAIHCGTRVRKNHTSRRDAFASIGAPPAAVWGRGGLESVDGSLPRRGAPAFSPKFRFERRVRLLKFYPSMPASIIDVAASAGARGVVIEGTGLGHTSSGCVRALSRFVKGGRVAFMTSQCIFGRVDMNVYPTGRDLLRAGVVPLEDMLPETALAKTMWALGNSSTRGEAVRLMTENIAGEITSRGFPG
jgi:glutamyl-tRNA(Gln) amidotransferase subunit D